MDIYDTKKRSEVMRAVKGTDTRPEWVVRKLVHRLGYRYRLHYSKLPGHPDLAFPSRKKVILVHGCFWHRHTCKQGASLPKTHRQQWKKKFQDNVKRDSSNELLLNQLGWSILRVWECETKSSLSNHLQHTIHTFLDSDGARC